MARGRSADKAGVEAMKALVLDFDGVIADSARESFAVALDAYRDLRPQSPLPLRDRSALYAGFVAAMPLGNGAADYGVVLSALESDRPLGDQSAYDAFRAEHPPEWLERYRRRFYEVRARLARQDPGTWRALMPPYAPLLDVLRRQVGRTTYAIATSKDRPSVEALLGAYGIADLFPGDRIRDKESGLRKSEHLRSLRTTLGVRFEEMTFVDDKVNHLDDVAPLGVRCALAAWGYNDRREHELARARGYSVCRLEDVERQLWG